MRCNGLIVITDPEDPNFDLEAWATLAQAGEV